MLLAKNFAQNMLHSDCDLNKTNSIYTFLEHCNIGTFMIEPIPGDASKRKYYRIHTLDKSYILMDSSHDTESFMSFLTIADFLCKNDLNAPDIINRNDQEFLILLEDLGKQSFNSFLNQNPALENEYYLLATKLLIKLQKKPVTLNLPLHNKSVLLNGIDVFCNWCLPELLPQTLFLEAQKSLMEIFDILLSSLGELKPVFVHRDFMADNILINHDRDDINSLGIIDFQDASIGSPAYDLVSLLEDARRDIPRNVTTNAFEYYIASLPTEQVAKFKTEYLLLSAQRNMRILGCFHRLNKRDDKPLYVKNYVPRVWRYLATTLESSELRPLKDWFDKYKIQV